jgi:GR25 family glycosyltransferase involved in LPS biosynthesis
MNNDLIDALYYINLTRSIQRRKTIKQTLKDETFKNMKKYRIYAVDANKPTIVNYLHNKMSNVNLEKYSIKEYCCLLSHLNAILTFSQSNYNIAFICEDDISLDYKKYWQEDLNTCIQHAPKDWEILQLSIVSDKLPTKLYTSSVAYWGAGAYLITKSGALRFIKHNYIDGKFKLNPNIKHPADYYIYGMMKTYTYKYPFFTYTAKDSTIHEHHVKKIHVPYKHKLGQLLKKRSRKNYHKILSA